jgi:hypothetical protein
MESFIAYFYYYAVKKWGNLKDYDIQNYNFDCCFVWV